MLPSMRAKHVISATVCIVILEIYFRNQVYPFRRHRPIDKSRLGHLASQLTVGLQEDVQSSDVFKSCRERLLTKLAKLGFPANVRQMNITHKAGCQAYHESGTTKHPVQFSVLESSTNVSDSNAVTLATHLTSDRYDKLVAIMKTWKGPASVSVYVKNTEDIPKFVHEVCSSYITHKWKNFQLHLVKEDVVIYPVNFLRNIAMKQVHSGFIFITDVDLVPMSDSYATLRRYTRQGKPGKDEVFIIPAFELTREKIFDMKDLPQDKDQLLAQWREGTIRPFHEKAYFPAYKFTNHRKWMNATQPYKVEWKRSYEPYVVIRKDSSPWFNEQFVGPHYDKSSYVMELQAMRFKFVVLPDVFTVHIPHSKKSHHWFRATGFFQCANKVHAEFVKMLKQRYDFHM